VIKSRFYKPLLAQFELDLASAPVYEAGASLMTLLVLPDGNDVARRSLMASL
jgi:hypothetical protein